MSQSISFPHGQKQNLDDAFRSILDLLSISTWVEDFSAVKQFFDQRKASGVADFRAYFYAHPEDVAHCASIIKILAINQAGLEVLGIESIDEIPPQLPQHFKEESWPAFSEEIITLAEGQLTFKTEITVRALSGGDNVVEMYLSVPPMYADTLERVLITFSNVTNRKQVENALRKSEARYRALFESSPIGIAVTRQGRILYANLAYAYMFGFSQPAELTGTMISDRVAEQDREQVIARDLRSEQGFPELTRYEVPALHQDGTIFQVALEVTPLSLDDGQALLFFAQDITDRQRAEEAEREQRQLAEALRDIASALNSSLDYDQILDTILTDVGKILANDSVDIIMIDKKNEGVIVRKKGYQGVGNQSFMDTRFNLADLPNLIRMIKTGQPVIIPDVRSDPDWVRFETQDWVRSYAGMPIRANGNVVGFIDLCSTKTNFYQPEHIERLAAMADQVAIAFTNASLVDELRQANDRLQAQLAEIQLLQSELREQAIRDPLTTLFNRRYLIETLHREIERARRESWPVSIIVIDIDHFKNLNDANGHKAGDLVLQHLGQLLKNNIRAGDIACRYGGEEFVIVMPNVYPLVAFERAEQIRLKFEWMRIPYEDKMLSSTISLGIAIFPLNASGDDEVLIRADRALYQAKQTGRNRTILYDNNPQTRPLKI
jgi:diguanylate cyclase (GGDEF)-like protein/PAS domain S-box-containing protein